jgi:hypothetical protein
MSEQSTPDVPQYRAARVQRALAEDERTAEQGVRVFVRGDDVYLRGQVACDVRRSTLDEVVHEVLPDAVIHNEVRVLTGAEPGGEEELR